MLSYINFQDSLQDTFSREVLDPGPYTEGQSGTSPLILFNKRIIRMEMEKKKTPFGNILPRNMFLFLCIKDDSKGKCETFQMPGELRKRGLFLYKLRQTTA